MDAVDEALPAGGVQMLAFAANDIVIHSCASMSYSGLGKIESLVAVGARGLQDHVVERFHFVRPAANDAVPIHHDIGGHTLDRPVFVQLGPLPDIPVDEGQVHATIHELLNQLHRFVDADRDHTRGAESSGWWDWRGIGETREDSCAVGCRGGRLCEGGGGGRMGYGLTLPSNPPTRSHDGGRNRSHVRNRVIGGQMRHRHRYPVVTLLLGVVIGGCSGLPSEAGDARTLTFDFDRGAQGFMAGFADYSPAHEEIYELTSGHRALPPPLESQSGLFISGVNRSGDLFMFFKGPVVGLTPGARYTVDVSVEIASSTPVGCFGIGGPPGEAVWIKAGATAEEPLAVMDGSYLRMNIDIGNQSTSGIQAVVLGNIANSRQCEQSLRWGNQGPGWQIDAGRDLRTRRWPRLASDRRRFGIRGQDGGLFHPGVSHVDSELRGCGRSIERGDDRAQP